jgi:hypothetical protein
MDGVMRSIVFLWPLAAVIYLYQWNDGEYKDWAWAPFLYLYFERSFRNMEDHNKHVEKRVSNLRGQLSGMRRDLLSRGVKVDVNDFANKAQKWGQNQARHQARR